jgi:hypothetical protein
MRTRPPMIESELILLEKKRRLSLSPEAQRALIEADERRKIQDLETHTQAEEIGGPKGLEPVRFGDWERGGIAKDF